MVLSRLPSEGEPAAPPPTYHEDKNLPHYENIVEIEDGHNHGPGNRTRRGRIDANQGRAKSRRGNQCTMMRSFSIFILAFILITLFGMLFVAVNATPAWIKGLHSQQDWCDSGRAIAILFSGVFIGFFGLAGFIVSSLRMCRRRSARTEGMLVVTFIAMTGLWIGLGLLFAWHGLCNEDDGPHGS